MTKFQFITFKICRNSQMSREPSHRGIYAKHAIFWNQSDVINDFETTCLQILCTFATVGQFSIESTNCSGSCNSTESSIPKPCPFCGRTWPASKDRGVTRKDITVLRLQLSTFASRHLEFSFTSLLRYKFHYFDKKESNFCNSISACNEV